MALLDHDWISGRERLFEVIRGQLQLAEATGASKIAVAKDDLEHLLSLAELGATPSQNTEGT